MGKCLLVEGIVAKSKSKSKGKNQKSKILERVSGRARRRRGEWGAS
jgi:hypothetical protein